MSDVNETSQTGIVLISLVGVWNLILSIISLINRRLPLYPYLIIAVDAVLALLFAGMVTDATQALLWAGPSVHHIQQGTELLA